MATSQNWFSEAFDRMSRDGRESQWRSLCEAEIPETASLPEKLDDVLNPIQRFCLLRAVRADRVVQIALSFVASVLGKRFEITVKLSLKKINNQLFIVINLFLLCFKVLFLRVQLISSRFTRRAHRNVSSFSTTPKSQKW